MKTVLQRTAMLFTSLLCISKPQGHYLPVPSICLMSKYRPFYSFIKLITILKPRMVQSLVTKCHFKNYAFIALIIAAMFFTSCKKENFADTFLNSTTSGKSSAQAQTGGGPSTNTSYGAFIRPPAGTNYLNFRLKVADQLGISCLRVPVIVPS